MSIATPSQVIFYPVKTNSEKLSLICVKVAESFLSGKRILIAVPSPEAAAYIDQLLWRQPEESFIPHLVSNKAPQERVVIAVNPAQNFNQAQIFLNLLPDASPLAAQFQMVYELFDETDASKAGQSRQRQDKYRQQGLAVSSQ